MSNVYGLPEGYSLSSYGPGHCLSHPSWGGKDKYFGTVSRAVEFALFDARQSALAEPAADDTGNLTAQQTDRLLTAARAGAITLDKIASIKWAGLRSNARHVSGLPETYRVTTIDPNVVFLFREGCIAPMRFSSVTDAVAHANAEERAAELKEAPEPAAPAADEKAGLIGWAAMRSGDRLSVSDLPEPYRLYSREPHSFFLWKDGWTAPMQLGSITSAVAYAKSVEAMSGEPEPCKPPAADEKIDPPLELRNAILFSDGSMLIARKGKRIPIEQFDKTGYRLALVELRVSSQMPDAQQPGTELPKPKRVQTFMSGRGFVVLPHGVTTVEPHFRFRDGVLQQRHSSTEGGLQWWIDVPSVVADALDVVFT